MVQRNIERTYDKLIPQCLTAYDALSRIGQSIGVLHNTALNFGADLFAVVGTSGEAGGTGTQNAYNEAKVSCGLKRQARRAKEREAKQMVKTVTNLLKPVYGTTWSSAWEGAGFSMGSLRQPKDPLPVLIEMRDHFRSNPALEVAAYSITANSIDAMVNELIAARGGLVGAISTSKAAKAARDLSLTVMRTRMMGLRRELLGILSDSDPRWYEFGLVRPIDRRVPLAVENLALRLGGAGEVIASWSASSRAANYRVSTQVAGSPDEPVQVAFTPSTEVVIPDVPLHSTLIVYVSAVNSVGETVATQAEIAIP